MNRHVAINKLKMNWDFDAIDSKFEFVVVASEERYSRFIDAVDNIFDLKTVHSVRYDYDSERSRMYLMLEKNEKNGIALREYVKGNPNWNHRFLTSKEIQEYILTQLLINSLSRSEIEEAKFNNITGKLFYINPAWISKNRKNLKVLQFKVKSNMVLLLPAVGFTHISEKDRIDFSKRKFNEYPQYILGEKYSLKRKKDPQEDAYIQRQVRGKKAVIKFLDLSDIDNFQSCKNGALLRAVELFNNKYEGMAKMDFERISFDSFEPHQNKNKELKNRVQKIISKKQVQIVDLVQDVDSEDCCANLQSALKIGYNIDVCRSAEINKDCLNICVLHDQEWYGEHDVDDPYYRRKNMPIQHITLEAISNSSMHAANVIVNEIIIKQDIFEKKITIDDWNARGYKEDLCFVMISEEDEELLIKMYIRPDGTFDISSCKRTETYDVVNPFYVFGSREEEKEMKGEDNLYGVIVSNRGDMNKIYDTEIFTIPENDMIYSQLKKNMKGGANVRKKEFKEKNLMACLDINYYECDRYAKYCVGAFFHDLDSSIPSACHVRAVVPHDKSKIFFKDIMQLMHVSFVRYNRMSILPYPFKYLREYSKMFIESKDYAD